MASSPNNLADCSFILSTDNICAGIRHIWDVIHVSKTAVSMPQAIIQLLSSSIKGRSFQRYYKVQIAQISVCNVPESSPCHASEQSLLLLLSPLSTLRNTKFLAFPVVSQNRTTLQFRPPSSPLHHSPFQFRYFPRAASSLPHFRYCRLISHPT
jgi:hypothetical protein